MQVIYLDWSTHRGVTILIEQGQKPLCVEDTQTFFDMDELLDWVSEPTLFISETTLESFRVERRQQIIDRIHAEGHEWKVTPNRHTPRQYQALGLPADAKKQSPKKGDDFDVCAIRAYATNPAHLKIAKVEYDQDKIDRRIAISKELTRMRKTATVVEGAKGGRKRINEKDLLSQRAIALLPDPKSLTETQRKVLTGANGKYREPIMAVVATGIQYTGSRKEFQSALGFFNHGFPSQARSDIYHHTWRHIKKAHPEVTSGDIQREVRWLYHQLKGHGTI